MKKSKMTTSDKIDEYLRLKPRQEVIEELKDYYDLGYRYVVRDFGSLDTLLLFTLEPKKYRGDYFWGYVNVDDPKAKMAQIIRNMDMTEISWNNDSPILIESYFTEPEMFEPERIDDK